MSIVVTAVYILRAIGQTVMGPIKEESFLDIKDASWNEKLAAVILITGIVAIGVAPFWLNDLVTADADLIIERVSQLNK